MVDCVVLSICAATGQLFIYYTLLKFGPIVFTIIMSLRQVNNRNCQLSDGAKIIVHFFQAIAILLSCIIYKHRITAFGIVGIFIVFLAISIRFYGSHRLRQIRQKADMLKSGYKPRAEV